MPSQTQEEDLSTIVAKYVKMYLPDCFFDNLQTATNKRTGGNFTKKETLGFVLALLTNQ